MDTTGSVGTGELASLLWSQKPVVIVIITDA